MSEVDVLAMAKDVARHLGDGWSAREGVRRQGTDAFIDGPDNTELHVSRGDGSNAGRMYINASLGDLVFHLRRDEESHHEITVSTSKSPDKIAREISGRLLPEYLKVRAIARARKAAAEDAEGERQELERELMAPLPGVQQLPSGSRFRFGLYGGDVSGEVKTLHGGGMAVFELRVTADVARELAAWLGQSVRWRDEHDEDE